MKKTAIDIPIKANVMAARSQMDRGRNAERIPIGIPTSSQMTAAPTASWIVTHIRSTSTCFSGARRTKDFPSPGQPY